MKKMLSILISLMMLTGILAGCGNNIDSHSDSEKLSVVTTIFPEYDWVKEVLGDKAENTQITMLLDNGVDLHSYQPTVDDIVKISNCDLFIYVGGESDGWVEDALKESANPDIQVINLLEVLGDSVQAEEMVEGMQEEEHEHDHGHEEIDESDIQDRTLAEFAGNWQSLLPMLTNGALDEYCAHEAEEADDGTTTASYRETMTAAWACDATNISISGNTITFIYADGTTKSADYTYAGYTPVPSDDGDIASVRYQFKTDSADSPKYVQFNDHGYEPGEVEHVHVYFGDESFEALVDSATNPFFAPAALDSAGVLEMLMGHVHGEEEVEYDEHVWLSLKNAAVLVREIADKLAILDTDNADAYSANANAYIEKLSALDGEYQSAVDAATVKTVLFGDRFPFRYLVDDYNLDYFAAFVGCSAETEASFETIVFLANKVDELGLKTVLTIENPQHTIADTIVENTIAKDAQVLPMDSMQATTFGDMDNGATYLSIMEQNLNVLKQALR